MNYAFTLFLKTIKIWQPMLKLQSKMLEEIFLTRGVIVPVEPVDTDSF